MACILHTSATRTDSQLKLLIIFNPNAAFGRSVKKLGDIKATIDSLGIHTTYLPTQYPGHGSELVANADLSGFDGVIAAGGDGTVFEVLNGLYTHPKPARIPLGLLPIGTGNAFARELGLQPGEWPDAIDLLSRGHTRQIDVAHVKSANQDFYFLNIIGMGFFIEAGLSAQKLKFLGNTAYTLAALWKVLKLKSYPLEMEVDGELLRRDNILVAISNSRYTGTHFLIAPDAVTDDGLLDVTILEKLPRRRLLKLFPTIYTGKHVLYDEITTHRASRIKINAPASMLLGPDGEFRGHTPAEITCLHRDLTIFSQY
jgi:diacylglycerol kinase (ATP)